MTPSIKPSSNWLALQNTFKLSQRQQKRRRIDHADSAPLSKKTSAYPRNDSPLPVKRHNLDCPNEHVDLKTTEVKNGEPLAALRKMVLGKVAYKTSQASPGKYLALDCEMVGVGIEGNESSLARVSIVNYTGAIILDVFVRQREKVVDYRTQWSGVRSTDLAGSAKPFKEVQQTVADLIKDRILVGHAIYNDLKALLLSHPSPQIRDTQSLAYKHHIVKSRRPALRVLVKQELDLVIQGGEHNSVTDARATMALFRLHKKQWEIGFKSCHGIAPPHSRNKDDDDRDSTTIAAAQSSSSLLSAPRRKRKHSESSKLDNDNMEDAAEASSSSLGLREHSPSSASHTRTSAQHISTSPNRLKHSSRSQPPANSAQRRGVSSGISTVTRRSGGVKEVKGNSMGIRPRGEKGSVTGSGSEFGKTGAVGEKWWRSLTGRKGSIKL